MADTKRGRDAKARREARAAELRIAEADLSAMDEDVDETDLYGEDLDLDAEDILPYVVDGARPNGTNGPRER